MTIFQIVFPIFAIAILGYLLAHRQYFRPPEIAGISRFVFMVAIPVMLFNAMAKISLPEALEWGFLLSYYLAAFITYALAMLIGRFCFNYTLAEQGIFGLACSYSNTVLIGIPVVLAAFGDKGQLPIFMLISVHSGIMFFIVTLIAETDGGTSNNPLRIAQQAAQKIATNSIVLGLAFGLLFNALTLELPVALDSTISRIAGAALPCALFVLGASLSRYQPQGHLSPASTIIVLKMAIHPFLVWLFAFHLFQVESPWAEIAVLTASLPVGINAYVFAEKYQVCIAPLATAILISTTLAMGSLSVMLWLLL